MCEKMNIPEHCQEDRCKEFFSLFARFEYAMKAVGFRKKENGRITILWNDMTDSVRDYLTDTDNDKLQTAITYILTKPPKKQDIVNDEIIWVDASANRGDDIYDLFVYIRRVRNNLFHGGKYHGKYLSDPQRSFELMDHCSTVLHACLHANNQLNEAYRQ